MKCEQARAWMAQALDGDLTAEDRARLNDHLDRCTACLTEWERLQAVERLLGGAPMVRPPVGFVGRTMARLDRRRRLQRMLLGGAALAFGAAAAASLTLIPTLWSLSDLGDSLIAFASVGDALVARLVGAVGTMLNSLWLTLGALALPAASLALCGFTMAVLANLLWLTLVRRLRCTQRQPLQIRR